MASRQRNCSRSILEDFPALRPRRMVAKLTVNSPPRSELASCDLHLHRVAVFGLRSQDEFALKG